MSDALRTNLEAKELTGLLEFHEIKISRLQHERLAHLITMMFVCLFFLLTLAFTLSRFSPAAVILTILLLALSAAYIFHYFRLENAVQRWYLISDRIRLKLRE